MPTTHLNYLPQMPKDRSVGIGCVGAGFIMADCQLVAYRAAGFNPVAITSKDPAHARRVADRHRIDRVYESYRKLLQDGSVQVLDIAVPPDVQLEVIEEAVQHADHLRGILAQKPLGVDYAQAKRIVQLCADAGITLAVNQNMRFDQSIRACKDLLDRNVLGEPVLATIDMRAIPHWMPWQQRLGWVTLRIMSIHHLDAFRYLFGEPTRVFCSTRPDPRTSQTFAHEDGIALYILEYDDSGLRCASWDDVWAGPSLEGAAADIGIRWRVEGTDGTARGTIGWPSYPLHTPSTIDYTTRSLGRWEQPRWDDAWFPDAFAGPMAALLIGLEEKRDPSISGRDNLRTMALVEACYISAREHRAIEPATIL